MVRAALGELEGQERENLEAQALLAGVLDAAGEREVLARLELSEGFGVLEIELLGALSGGAVRRSAQALLRDLLLVPPADAARREAVVRACDHALEELFTRRRDDEADELRTIVWTLTQAQTHPLHEELSTGRWPKPAQALPVRWPRREREVPDELWSGPPPPPEER